MTTPPSLVVAIDDSCVESLNGSEIASSLGQSTPGALDAVCATQWSRNVCWLPASDFATHTPTSSPFVVAGSAQATAVVASSTPAALSKPLPSGRLVVDAVSRLKLVNVPSAPTATPTSLATVSAMPADGGERRR